MVHLSPGPVCLPAWSPDATAVWRPGGVSGKRDLVTAEIVWIESAAVMAEVPAALRVLVANQRRDRLDILAAIVAEAGHQVIARSVGIDAVADIARHEDPDLAIVAVGESNEHALALIGELVDEAVCAVIVVLEESDPDLVAAAARQGVFGHLTDADPPELQSAIEIAFRRFEDFRALREAFVRRALVERAKGVLMQREQLDERSAFEVLRSEARARRIPLVDVARGVLDALPRGTGNEAAHSGG